MTSSFRGQAGTFASSIGLKSFSPTAGVGGTSMLPAESRTHSSAMTLGADMATAIAAANAARLCVLIDGSPVHFQRHLQSAVAARAAADFAGISRIQRILTLLAVGSKFRVR